jgi:hypothetical protein
MSKFEGGVLQVELLQELRTLAERGSDIPELVELLLNRLELAPRDAVIPVIVYFRSAFDLSLREALPLREWIGGKDRTEIDSILIPALKRSRKRWQASSPLPV